VTTGLSKKKRVAFICSGGAVKAAAYHVGVAMALEHNGFRFQGGIEADQFTGYQSNPSKTVQVYVGSSAGSLVTTYLSQGGKLKDLLSTFQADPKSEGIPGLKYWEMLSPRIKKPLDLLDSPNFLLRLLRERTLPSPFSTDGIVSYLRSHVLQTDRFSDLVADLFIVATEVNRARKVVFSRYRSISDDPFTEYRSDVAVSDACGASMALPPVYHPYSIQIDEQRREFFDGEIREPLSSHIGRDAGADLIICSYTHQPLTLNSRRVNLAEKGIEQVTLQAIYQSIEAKIQVARGYRKLEKALLDEVSNFFTEKGLGEKLRDELIAKLENRMTYYPEVDYIYIHPRPSDHEAFLMPHFSLKRKHTERIVRKGYVSAAVALRNFEKTVES
jgi:predicted acylesterase/phospholipase RssA